MRLETELRKYSKYCQSNSVNSKKPKKSSPSTACARLLSMLLNVGKERARVEDLKDR